MQTNLMAPLIIAVMLVAPLFGADPAMEKLYAGRCASCHGKKGEGNKALAGALKVTAQAMALNDAETLGKTDEDLLKILSDGQGKMPGFAKTLKPEELQALITMIRSWEAPKAPTPPTQ